MFAGHLDGIQILRLDAQSRNQCTTSKDCTTSASLWRELDIEDWKKVQKNSGEKWCEDEMKNQQLVQSIKRKHSSVRCRTEGESHPKFVSIFSSS